MKRKRNSRRKIYNNKTVRLSQSIFDPADLIMSERPPQIDLYGLIGVHRTAGKSVIRRRCLELCKIFHPDRRPHHISEEFGERKIREINTAKEWLCDDDKRIQYNRQNIQERSEFDLSSNDEQWFQNIVTEFNDEGVQNKSCLVM